jgi:hypothetical protein
MGTVSSLFDDSHANNPQINRNVDTQPAQSLEQMVADVKAANRWCEPLFWLQAVLFLSVYSVAQSFFI